MNDPAAIKELEKIEMIRQNSGEYRLDHAVTATQKAILKTFQMDGSVYTERSGKNKGSIIERRGKGMSRPRKRLTTAEKIEQAEAVVLKRKEE